MTQSAPIGAIALIGSYERRIIRPDHKPSDEASALKEHFQQCNDEPHA